MAFGGKNAQAAVIGGDRLAAIAGSAPTAAAADVASPGAVATAPRRSADLQPDPSRIRPRQIEETPETRKRRLAAKTVNFTATIIARIVIIGGAGLWAWKQYEYTGQIHRGVAVGVFIMFGDLGRVLLKAMEPGTK